MDSFCEMGTSFHPTVRTPTSLQSPQILTVKRTFVVVLCWFDTVLPHYLFYIYFSQESIFNKRAIYTYYSIFQQIEEGSLDLLQAFENYPISPLPDMAHTLNLVRTYGIELGVFIRAGMQ